MEAKFKTFASRANGAEATSADINKWAKDAGVLGRNLTSNHIDIAFSKAKVLGAKNVTIKEMDSLIEEMAKAYKDDKKIGQEAAEIDLRQKLLNADFKLHGITLAAKDHCIDRLTDPSKYTGSHKERFDENGKGRGIAGRVYLFDTSGYVHSYKGKGTYDKKHFQKPCEKSRPIAV